MAFGSASQYIKTLYFLLTVLALSAAATVANIKIRYDAKTPQFAIFGTRVICVFYSISLIQVQINYEEFIKCIVYCDMSSGNCVHPNVTFYVFLCVTKLSPRYHIGTRDSPITSFITITGLVQINL